MQQSDILFHLAEHREQYFNAVAPPIIQSSNFCMPDLSTFRAFYADELHHHLYTRGNNPTVGMLRKKLAALEKTEDALVFSSGAAAVAAAVLGNVSAGDHVVCQQQPYAWTGILLRKFLSRFGVSSTFVDGTDLQNIASAIQSNTKVLYLESPNSLTFECQDLSACAELCRAHGLVSIIDNSYCSPIFQNPSTFGIDIVVHSGTKYINGHSDVVLGVLCASEKMVRRIFQSEFMTLGAVLSPHDAALALRGLRTLPLRMQQSFATAQFLVEKLSQHPKVERIYYPFHPDFPQFALARRQMRGCGGLFSVNFRTDSFERMEAFVHAIRRFLMAVSWGGYESLMLPAIGFYRIEGRQPPALPFTFVRFYAGLEDANWLWEDLQQAMVQL